MYYSSSLAGRRCGAAVVGLLALVFLPQVARPQDESLPSPRSQPRTDDENLYLTASAEATFAQGKSIGISLNTALRLAASTNLDIQIAQTVVREAQARFAGARALILPNVFWSTAYFDHEGRIQQANGNVLNRNRNSLWLAGGPALQVQLADAFFLPLVARQVLNATEANQQRVSNDTMLAVADAYFAVLRARRRLARLDEVLDFLASDRKAATRGDSKGLLPLIKDFVAVGGKEALKADVALIESEVLRRREEQAAALQEYRVASAELARLIRLHPETPLWPVEDPRYPMALPGDEWSVKPLEELVAFALGNRPELAENQALVQAAQVRVRAAKVRPFVPTLTVQYGEGYFGGSPLIIDRDLEKQRDIFGNSGQILNFGHRADLEASVVWRAQNLGLGNLAEIRGLQAALDQSVLRGARIHDVVIAQVVQTLAVVQQSQQRIDITRSSLISPQGELDGPVYRSIRLNFDRVRGAEGRPLELLISIRSLNELLEAYIQSITDSERARFRLLVTLGIPPERLFHNEPKPPEPAAPLPPPVKK